MNHAAVRAVSMRTLNRQRANIVFSTLFDTGTVLSPEEVSKRERIFERDGVLRWREESVLGYCKIGVPLSVLLQSLLPRTEVTGSTRDTDKRLSRIWDLYRDEDYVLWYNPLKTEAMIVLKGKSSPTSQLKAWAQAWSVAHLHQQKSKGEQKTGKEEATYTALKDTLTDLSFTFESHLQSLRMAGWDVDTAALETSSGRRMIIKQTSRKQQGK